MGYRQLVAIDWEIVHSIIGYSGLPGADMLQTKPIRETSNLLYDYIDFGISWVTGSFTLFRIKNPHVPGVVFIGSPLGMVL